MLKKLISVVVLGFSSAACTPPPPVVSDISQDKVVVQAMIDNPDQRVAALATANEQCAMYKRTAVPLSKRLANGAYYYLYACKPNI